MAQAPLIGIATGLVSAILFVSASSGTFLGVMVLFFLAPMPIAIAGLGWGTTAAIAAAASGTATIAILGQIPAVLFYVAAIALPMAAASYLLMLSRQVAGEDPDKPIILEWYPVGRVVAYSALWAAVLATLALLSTGSDLDDLRQTLRATLEKMISGTGPMPATIKRPLTEQEKTAFVDLMIATLPGALATIWLIAALLNLWLAGHAARLSARLARPWPDLANLTLPRQTPIFFAAAIAATMIGGVTAIAASALAFSIMAAYMLVGLAIVHWATRGMTLRPAILTATYASLLVLNPFSGLILAGVALAEPLAPIRRNHPPPPD